MKRKQNFVCPWVWAVAAATLSASAHADVAKDFPLKPVRLVVGQSPGSQSDSVARLLAQKMSENWGKPVVIDNRAGAGGTPAAMLVAKATADGYTLLVTSPTYAITAALQTNLPFDPLKDIAGVAQIGHSTGALVAAHALGAKSVKDLITMAKAQPGKLIYASSAAGNLSHLNGEKFRLAAGIKVVNVAFKSGSDGLIETLAGRTHYSFVGLGPAMPFITSGKLLALAVTTPQRAPQLPDVPALAETIPGFSHEGAYGVLAPVKTPRAVLNRISTEVTRILKLPDVREKLQNMAFAAAPGTPEDYDKSLRESIAGFTKLALAIGLRK
jgi:tripartite-type tricarboxylate transporter receptor subunit TctC